MSSRSSSFDSITLSSDSGHDNDSMRCSPALSAITINSTDSGTSGHDKLNYHFCSFVQDSARNRKEIWAVDFNHFLKDGEENIFAAVSGPRFYVYKTTANGKMELLMCFEDADPDEDFWTCCWSVNVSRAPILITGGSRGVIRIVNIDLAKNDWDVEPNNLIGHGEAINQVKIAPRQPYLLASASKDRSIRLWNIETKVCIATFHGVDSHRDEVVSIDFNFESTKLVSGGLDHMVAIWDLTTPEISAAIEMSTKYDANTSTRDFKTFFHPFPTFTTRRIHKNYVDCVKWFGDFILSKSTENDLCGWMTDILPCDSKYLGTLAAPPDACTKLIEFNVENCDYYFVRFATNTIRGILAIGNMKGVVRLFDLETGDIAFETITNSRCTKNVRDLSFSRNGRDLVFCSDDGKIWLYQN
ncbi:polycomb protein esc-like [Contarinia nasturtii]|uniref:polycomb protein esc-like n=1 Tax=Contarinia nasturtii TaxID=265458 RepID=UPI0012D4A9E5|nr:polycomb protein esc-like [Contarinia nasturtii]